MSSRLLDAALRWPMRTVYQCLRAYWFFRRPKALGAHAFAFTSDNRLILVKVRYSGGWRLPGGGRHQNEHAVAAVKRELREEIGMLQVGSLELAYEAQGEFDFRQGEASYFVAKDVEYQPSWSLEVEQVEAFSLDALPGGLGSELAQKAQALAFPLSRDIKGAGWG